MTETAREASVHRTFGDGWRVYERMLVNDYLGHRALYGAARDWLVAHVARPISVFELGCGDASQTAWLLDGLPVAAYAGVDHPSRRSQPCPRT